MLLRCTSSVSLTSKTLKMLLEIKVIQFLKPFNKTSINFLLVIVLSFVLGICLDHGISFYITFYYRESEPYMLLDAPTFQRLKAPIHHCLLLCTWVPTSLFVIIWRYVNKGTSVDFLQLLLSCNSSTDYRIRFFTISFQPGEIQFVATWKNRDQYKIKETRTDGSQMEADNTSSYPLETQTVRNQYPEDETQKDECQDSEEDTQQKIERQDAEDGTPKDECQASEEDTQQEDECQDTEDTQTETDNTNDDPLESRTDEYQCTEGKYFITLSKICSPVPSTAWGKNTLEILKRQSVPTSPAKKTGACSDSVMSLQPTSREHKNTNAPTLSAQPLTPAFSTGMIGTISDPFVSGRLPSRRPWRFSALPPSAQQSRPGISAGIRGADLAPRLGGYQLGRGHGHFISSVSPAQAPLTLDDNGSPSYSLTKRNFRHESLNAPIPKVSSTSKLNESPFHTPIKHLPSISEGFRSLPDTPTRTNPEPPDFPSSSNPKYKDSPLESEASLCAAKAAISPYAMGSRAPNQPFSPFTSMSSRATAPIMNPFIAQNNGQSIGRGLRQEVESWGELVPSNWEEYINFKPLSRQSPKQLAKEQRSLEEACAQKRVMEVKPFQVCGTHECFDYDRVKCWVLFNRHLHEEDWPVGYVPTTPVEELRKCKYNEEDEESNASFF